MQELDTTQLEEKTQQELSPPSTEQGDKKKKSKKATRGGKPKNTKKKLLKWLRVLVILVVIVAAVYYFMLRPSVESLRQAAAASYIPYQVEMRELTVSVKGTATIEPNDSFRVTTLVRGEVTSAPFEEGDIISEGALLYRIDAFDAETAISQAQLAVEQAQLNYNDVLDNQSRSSKLLDVKANASGVVTTLNIKLGDNVTAGTAVATIVDRDNMLLTVPFHSVNVAEFYVGQSATVSVSGTLETISGVIDEIAYVDSTGAGGTVVRNVTIKVKNPGTLDSTTLGTATIGEYSCASAGYFQNAAESIVYAQSSGEIDKLYISEGDSVYDGQLIASMPEISYESQREQALISLNNAKLSLESAQNALDNYSITSPISGTVVEKNVKAGDNIDTTTTTGYLAVIFDLTRLKFDLNVDELDISKIQVGQRVEITVEAASDQTYYGYVEKININGQTANGVTVYPVTIYIDEPGDLLPGMNVNAEIICEQTGMVPTIPVDAVSRGNVVISVPGSAISEDGESLIDMTAMQEIEAELGRNDRDYIEVVSGLSEGDWVLVNNQASDFYGMMMMG